LCTLPCHFGDDAGNFERHFNAAALTTRPFQVAPDPKKRTKLLQPATFEPFTPEDFAFMTRIEGLLAVFEKRVVWFERTARKLDVPGGRGWRSATVGFARSRISSGGSSTSGQWTGSISAVASIRPQIMKIIIRVQSIFEQL
jgi:hypothetical protein